MLVVLVGMGDGFKKRLCPFDKAEIVENGERI